MPHTDDIRRNVIARPSLRAFISEHDNNPLAFGPGRKRGSSMERSTLNCGGIEANKNGPDDMFVDMMEIDNDTGNPCKLNCKIL